jgi:hypothetical protein
MMSDCGQLPELEDSDDVELMDLEEQMEDHDLLQGLKSVEPEEACDSIGVKV